MNKIKVGKFRIKDIETFEHLKFIIKNTTPHQRYRGLEQLWDFWYEVRKTLSKRIIALQDKFRAGKI